MNAHGDTGAALRILDANANRAREAVRVLEEFARFVIEDAHLSERCKKLRHKLQQTLAEVTGLQLASFRDTPGDVGTTISVERERSSLGDVIAAAANRLTEALRAIEEYGKSIDRSLSANVEKLRYEAYTLSSQLMRRAAPIHDFAGVKLYVLISEALCYGDWFDTAEAALQGGAGALQLREKELSDRNLLERAKRLRESCDGQGALLIVNDRPDIALAACAHGVHLGQRDLPVREARRFLGPRFIIGLSTHSVEQVQEALRDPPDYLAVGPMFASSTKLQDRLAGPETLKQVRKLTSLPLVAIGGITPQNAGQLGQADTLAVCSAIVAEADVAEAVKRFL